MGKAFTGLTAKTGVIALLASSMFVAALSGTDSVSATVSQDLIPAPAQYPHAPVEWSGGTGQAELHIAGDTAVLTLRRPDGTVFKIRNIGNTDDALAILADERLSFAWPALLKWAGSDLSLLRDRTLVRSQAAFESGLMAETPQGRAERWAGNVQTISVLQYARVLAASGRRDDAVAMLRQNIARLAHTPERAFDRAFFTTALARLLFRSGDADGSITLLKQLDADPTMVTDQKMNIEANLAHYLARSGSAQEALVMIDKVWDEYRITEPADPATQKLPDSDAQFASVKACALYKLGRREEAMNLVALIERRSADTTEIPATNQARIRTFDCMGDVVALSNEFAGELATALPASDLLIELQPDGQTFAPDREQRKAALQQPALRAAIARRVRLLSGEMEPAVSHWTKSN